MNRTHSSSTPASRRPVLALFVATLVAVFFAGPASGATITWSNAAGGAWSNAANWSPATVPGSGDAVVLPALSGAYTVTLDVNPAAASVSIAAGDPTLDVNGQSIGAIGSISNSGTIANFAGTYSGAQVANHTGGLIVSADGATITLGGDVTNDGTIRISGTGTQLVANGGPWIHGSGTIRMDGGTITTPVADAWSDAPLKLDSGQTLAGVGVVRKVIENHGTILADQDSGELRFRQGCAILNYGTVRLENDGRIRTEGAAVFGRGGKITTGSGGGTLDTANLDFGRWGTIDLSHGSAIEMNGGDLTITCEMMWGGPIRSLAGGGTMKISVGSIQQVSIEENTDVSVTDHVDFLRKGEHLRIDGRLHVPGSVAFGMWPDTVDVLGTGSIELEGGTLGNGNELAGVLRCDAGFTIHGSGTINPPFVNEGTVDLNGVFRVPEPNLRVTDLSRKWLNEGLLRIGRSPVTVSGARARLTNAGRIETTVAGGSLQLVKGGTLDNRGGVITSSGGTVKIGNLDSYGTLIGGRLECGPGGEFVVGRGATLRDVTVGTTGVLHVLPNATAVLAGSLTNLGTVRLTGTGRIAGDATGVYVQKGGVTALEGGSLVTSRDVLLQAGALRGFGTVSANLRNAGTVSPDAAATALRVGGNYTQLAGGTLQVSIAGAAASQRSHFQVDGAAALAGGLDAQLTNGFAPAAGSRFDVFTYGSMTGSFDAASAAAGGASSPLVPVFEPGVMSLVTSGVTAVGDPRSGLGALRFFASTTRAGTSFVLELPYAADVKGRIYDAAGREVATIGDGAMPAGVHAFAINRAGGVQDLASGVYFARMSIVADGAEQVRMARAVVIR